MVKEKASDKGMNYIRLINRFWKVDLEWLFTGSETRLYMFLLHSSNVLGWRNPVSLSYRQLEVGAGLSVNTIVAGRERLKEAGLIDFTAGKQGSGRNYANKTLYTLKVSKFDSLTDSSTDSSKSGSTDTSADSSKGGSTDSPADGSTDGLTEDVNKQETINENKNNIPPVVPPDESVGGTVGNGSGDRPGEAASVAAEPEAAQGATAGATPPSGAGKEEKGCAEKEERPLELPFGSEVFRAAWERLRVSPRWREKDGGALGTVLVQLGRYEEGFALLLVEQALVNNWQAVVFAETEGRYREWLAAREGTGRPAGGRLNVVNHNNSKVYEEF